MFSASELLFGAFIVIGHNVFHIVPNEVIVLCLLGLASIRLRDGGWAAMGFKRPASWRRLVLIALAAAVLRILLGQFVIEPVTGVFWPAPAAPELANEITGNPKIALLALPLCGRLLHSVKRSRIEDIFLPVQPTSETDQHRPAGLASCSSPFYLATAIYYKGPSGIIDSGIAGLIFGTAYVVAGRNLWASILTHGMIDTFGVIDASFRWSK